MTENPSPRELPDGPVILDRMWDIVIIGTGIGGATLGRALAEKGWSVLFLEKGRIGYRAEQNSLSPLIREPTARLVRGLWPDKVIGTVDGKSYEFYAPLGCGGGGSSVFYAATLERPEQRDLESTTECQHPTGGWPFSWEEFLPWLEYAESLYDVRGGVGSLSSEPISDSELNPSAGGSLSIEGRLRSNGCCPYQLGSAVKSIEGCLSCLGVKCPRHCKMDARSAGLEPALATGRAKVLDECEVTAIRGTVDEVTHVEFFHKGRRSKLRAKNFALAAGALNSPRILLRSDSMVWPRGCGNQHGVVGRNLMFHLNEMFFIWPPSRTSIGSAKKNVGLRDLYSVEGHRLGMVQAMGVEVNYGEIAYFLKEQMQSRGLGSLATLAPMIALPASRILGKAQLFVGLLEDLPYSDNRVYLDRDQPSRVCFRYQIRPELLTRRAYFRKLIRRAFKGLKPIFANWRPELNYGHPCGTLRAGSDPHISVLSPGCRVHGISNLYVVDASFFPSSMGVNPSLTIAANALRVADLMESGRC